MLKNIICPYRGIPGGQQERIFRPKKQPAAFIKKAFIYRIKNKINGRTYIGSTNNIVFRFKQHLSLPNRKMRSDLKEFGVEAFQIEELECCEYKDSFAIEEKYLIAEKPYYNTLLKTPSGERLFGGQERETFMLRLPIDLADNLTKIAKQQDLSRNQLIERILKKVALLDKKTF